jgi:uncharacterized membrane protein YebE (DUF533 family)
MENDSESRAAARAHLAGLLPRVMADGKLDESEKQELMALFRRAVLTTTDVRDVFAQYLRGITNEVLADGIITAEERARCRAAVQELRIPRSFLSPELIAIVDGKM